MRFFLVFLALFVFLQNANAYQEITVTDGGTIQGKVIWKSALPSPQTFTVTKDQQVCGETKTVAMVLGKDAGVPNAVVYLEQISAGKNFPSLAKVQLDQKNCEYVPHVLIVPPNAEVEIMNSDPAFHNVHAYNMVPNDTGRPQTIFNLAFPVQGQKVTKKFETTNTILSLCDGGHPWMNAHIFKTEHPYYVVTDADGNFTLDQVPAGKYTLKLWHEGVPQFQVKSNSGFLKAEPKQQSKEITVSKGGVLKIDFEL